MPKKSSFKKIENFTELLCEKKITKSATFANGSFFIRQDNSFLISSLSYISKDGKQIKTTRSLSDNGRGFVSSSLPFEIMFPYFLNENNPVFFSDDSLSLSYSLNSSNSYKADSSNSIDGIIDYYLSDDSVLGVSVLENGIVFELFITEEKEKIQLDFLVDTIDCRLAMHDSGIVVLDKSNQIIYKFSNPYIVDAFDNKNPYDCVIDLNNNHIIISSKSNDFVFPISVFLSMTKVQNYVVEFSTNSAYYSGSSLLVGRKKAESSTASIDIDAESLVQLISKQGIVSFKAELNIPYSSNTEDRKEDSPGFYIDDGVEILAKGDFNEPDGFINVDITKLIEREYRLFANGGYLPKKISLTISYAGEETAVSPVLADNDYILIHDIEYSQAEARPYISLICTRDSFIKNNTPMKEINCAEAGISFLNAFTGNIFHNFYLGVFQEGQLSLPVFLHYDSRLIHDDTSFGKGWMLSFERKLIKDSSFSKTKGIKSIIYQDENADTHLLEETLYYEKNGVIHDVEEESVYLGKNGSLFFDIKDASGNIVETTEVQYKLKSKDGLQYLSSSQNVYQAKTDRKINLKKSIINYKIGNMSFSSNDLSTGKIKAKVFYQIIPSDKAANYFFWAKEYLESKSTYAAISFVNPKQVRFKDDGTPCFGNEVLRSMELEIPFILGEDKAILLFPRDRIYENAIHGSYPTGSYIQHGTYEYLGEVSFFHDSVIEKTTLYLSNETIESIKEQINSINSTIDQIQYTLKSYKTNYDSSVFQCGHTRMAKTLGDVSYSRLLLENEASDSLNGWDLSNEKTKNYILARNSYYENSNRQRIESDTYNRTSSNEQLDTILNQINYLNEQLVLCTEKKRNLIEKLESVSESAKMAEYDYISAGGEKCIAFNYFGNQTAIYGANNESISINYESNKIVRIKGCSGKTIRIHYGNDGNPDYLQMQDGRRFSFIYEKGKLSSISWIAEQNREAIAMFKYDSSDRISEIYSVGYKRSCFFYKSNTVFNIRVYSLKDEISLDSDSEDESEKLIASYYFSKYGFCRSTFSDDLNNFSEEFCFDGDGNHISTEARNLTREEYYMSCPSDDGLLYSLFSIPEDECGNQRDIIEYYRFGREISKSSQVEIPVNDLRKKIRADGLVGLILEIKETAIVATKTLGFSLIVEQYDEEDRIISGQTFEFSNCSNGIVCAPMKIRAGTHSAVVIFSCDSGMTIDFSLLPPAMLCHVRGDLSYYEDDILRKADSNEFSVDFSEFASKIPTKSVFYDNFERKYISRFLVDGDDKIIFSKDIHDNCISFDYDENNRITVTKTYCLNDPTACEITKISYTDKGTSYETEGVLKDRNGTFRTKIVEYDAFNDLLLKEKFPDGSCIIHGYDPYSLLETVTTTDDNGIAISIFRQYKQGLLVSLCHEGGEFHYGYDGMGRRTWIAINDNKLFIYDYRDSSDDRDLGLLGSVEKATDCLGYTVETVTDPYGRIVSKTLGDYHFEYSYDSNDCLREKKDENNNIVYQYEYDIDCRILQSSCTDESKELIKGFDYDNYGRLKQTNIKLDNVVYSISEFIYDDKDRIKDCSVSICDASFSVQYIYGSQGTLSKKQVSFERSNLKSTFAYLRQEEHSTDFISRYELSLNNELILLQNLSYDVMGNVVLIRQKNESILYSYDNLGRLTEEKNEDSKRSVHYIYDSAGNILKKEEYIDGNLQNTWRFKYENDIWKDQLTEIRKHNDDEELTYTFDYDEMGRPIYYKDCLISWNLNGTLMSYGNNSYAYNSDGIRIRKNTESREEKYILDGNRILRIEGNCYNLDFLWSSERIEGCVYNGKKYLFIRNVFNDVVGILDADDNAIVVRYHYDAFGKCDVIPADGYSETDVSFIGNVNPIRYRGYFFDEETGFYYLQSRYYDPETGRFISPDCFTILDENQGTINGLNLYMYCFSNPIMYTDESGHFPNWAKWLIGSLVIVGLAAATLVTGGASAAGICGFIFCEAFKGALAGAISSMFIGGIVGGISSSASGRGFLKGFANGSANGFMWGAIIGGITGAISGTIQTQRAIANWDKGTFGSGYESLKHHYTTEVIEKGLKRDNSLVKYTKDALGFADRNGSSFVYNLNRSGRQNTWSLPRSFGSGTSGLYTSSGKIISFHYFFEF